MKVYHNHVWRRQLELGLPDPSDPDDDVCVVQQRLGDEKGLLAFTREEWVPLLTAFMEVSNARGSAATG
jgi:hypothetical protein